MTGQEAREGERGALARLLRPWAFTDEEWPSPTHKAIEQRYALEQADQILAAGYRKHPVPRHGVSGRMVEQAITAAWGDETWRDWNEQAVREELDSMRRALEAAGPWVPVGEGEQ